MNSTMPLTFSIQSMFYAANKIIVGFVSRSSSLFLCKNQYEDIVTLFRGILE